MEQQIANMLAQVKTPAQPAQPAQPGQSAAFTPTPIADPNLPAQPVPAPAAQSQPGQPNFAPLPDGYQPGPTPDQLNVINPPNLEAKPGDEQPAPPPDAGAEQYKQLTVGLLTQLQQMAQQMGQMQGTIVSLQSQQKPADLGDAFKPAPLQNTALVTADDLKGIVNEDKTVNVEALMRAMQAVGERSYQLSREHTHRDLPNLLQPMIQRHTQMHSTATLFWDKNKDIEPFRDRVANEANTIYAQQPHLSINQVYDMAAKKVREDLAAYAKAAGIVQNPQPTNPAFPPAFVPPVGGGGADRPPPGGPQQPTTMQQEIQQLLKVAGAL
jgi:hypothetical protein